MGSGGVFGSTVCLCASSDSPRLELSEIVLGSSIFSCQWGWMATYFLSLFIYLVSMGRQLWFFLETSLHFLDGWDGSMDGLMIWRQE